MAMSGKDERVCPHSVKALFALLLLVPLTSCCTGTKSPVAIYRGEWNADDSRLDGYLRLVDGCLVLTDDAGQEWVVVFAAETTWDSAGKAVNYPPQTLRVDSRVAVGGSGLPGHQADWIHPPAKGCGSRPLWFASRSGGRPR